MKTGWDFHSSFFLFLLVLAVSVERERERERKRLEELGGLLRHRNRRTHLSLQARQQPGLGGSGGSPDSSVAGAEVQHLHLQTLLLILPLLILPGRPGRP
jgi:hypothetical protein